MFINRISPSKLSTYKECHFKYRAKYHDHLPESRSDTALQFGSYIHKILERGVAEFTLSGLEKIAEEERSNYKFDAADYSDKKIKKCLQNFLEFNSKLEGENVGLELNEVMLVGDIEYNGIIDRVIKGKDNTYLVIDYKTSKSEKSKLDLYSDHQLLAYAIIISKKYGVPISKIICGHFYPLTGNFVSLTYTKPQETKFNNEVKSVVWAIRKKTLEDLLPIRNKFCNYCQFKALCPLFIGKENSDRLIKEHKERVSKKKD
jgi:CRISPR/Cas system-associated exonuclease Cas4 (RecB family)